MSLNKHKKGLSRKKEQEDYSKADLKQRVLFFILTIFRVGHTNLLQVYRCYWTYVGITILSRSLLLKVLSWSGLSACLLVCFVCYQVVIKLMLTQYIAFGPPQKAIRKRPLFKHKNGCAAPISKVEHIIHNFKNHILVTWPATNLLILRKWCGFEKPNHYSFV